MGRVLRMEVKCGPECREFCGAVLHFWEANIFTRMLRLYRNTVYSRLNKVLIKIRMLHY